MRIPSIFNSINPVAAGDAHRPDAPGYTAPVDFEQLIAQSGATAPASPDAATAKGKTAGKTASPELREAFHDFVGQTFFGQMIQALRKTQQESKYFHGGQAERIFQAQFDQTLSEQLSESSAEQIADPMFELFQLGRRS